MASYRYLFGPAAQVTGVGNRLVPGTFGVEIPVFGAYITDRLNDVGYMQGTFQLDQTGKSNDDLTAFTVPGTSFLCVLRDEQLIWTGVITSRTYQAQSKTLQFFAKTLESHLDNRLVVQPQFPFGVSFVRTDVDQGTIFWDLMALLDTAYPAFLMVYDNGTVEVPAPVTGVLKSINIKATDFKTIREAVNEIADGSDGFDWRFKPRLEIIDGRPRILQAEVEFGYPTLDRVANPAGLVFEFPGNILNYYRTDNLAGAGTRLFVLGAGQGESMIFSVVDPVSGYGNFPVHQVVPLKDVTTQALLDARAAQEAIRRKPPRTQYKIGVRPGLQPIFGQWQLGDSCTIRIDDAMHPGGVDTVARITGYELKPSSAENAEEVFVEFEGID